jgi:hypothetical protein
MSIEEQTISRLTETYAEAQSTQAGPGRDQAAHGRPSLLCTEMLDLQRNLLQQQQSNPVPDRVSLHEKLYLHLADEQITDAEALLTFRRRLQAMFYPDYADTLSVQVLLANLSDVRRQYLQDWIDRVESMGRYDSEDKEWLEYRLVHADLHCRRVHDELRATEEERLFQFHEGNEKRPNGPKRARRGVKLTLS